MERKRKGTELPPPGQINPTKTVGDPTTDKVRWKKIGGGSLRLGNRIIKPGEIFYASESELPKTFMDTLVCLDKEDLQKIKDGTKQASKISEVLYRLENDATFKGLWNVVNEEGKAINEKPLEKAIAEELLTAINY